MLKHVKHYYQWLPSTIHHKTKISQSSPYSFRIQGPHKGSPTSPIPGQLADHGPVPGGGTNEHTDRGRPDTALRVDNQSREVGSQTHSGFFRLWATNTT